ncbi:MAG TPA: hypothetical protein VGF99_19010, partial [Myxococcota bacterium]
STGVNAYAALYVPPDNTGIAAAKAAAEQANTRIGDGTQTGDVARRSDITTGGGGGGGGNKSITLQDKTIQ